MYTKKTVYTLPYITEQDIEKVNELRAELYETHNSVQVYPQGSYAVIIEASEEVTA